jgi:hypothetical protein
MTKFLSSILTEIMDGRVGFWCPGCQEPHHIPVAPERQPGARWGYNGDPARPTFTPSILVRSGHYLPGWKAETCYCEPRADGDDWGFECQSCHSYVTDGRIQFLPDSSHALAGQTVDLPPYPRDTDGSTLADSDGDDGA